MHMEQLQQKQLHSPFTPVRPDQGLFQETKWSDYTGVWWDVSPLKTVDLDYWQVLKTWPSDLICSETWPFWTSLIWTIHVDEHWSVATVAIFAALLTQDYASNAHISTIASFKEILLPEYLFR